LKDENRFNLDFIRDLNQFLDEVERNGSQALIMTCSGKIFSNGLDLDWIRNQPDVQATSAKLADAYMKLLSRLLTYPVPTIAAVNGHAFGAGFLFCLAFDYRIMNKERGFVCIPAINLGITLSSGMIHLAKQKVTNPITLREMILVGKRFTGLEAAKLGLVDDAVAPSHVLTHSVMLASSLKRIGTSETRKTLSNLKQELYKETSTLLQAPTSNPTENYGPLSGGLSFATGKVPVDGSKKAKL